MRPTFGHLAGRRGYIGCMRGDDEPVEDLIRPEDFLPQRPMPGDARRMGLDRNTEEGALVALASSLDPAKLSHRIVAWLLLVALVAPLLLSVWRQVL